jgi:hypothetical protein
MHQTVKDVKNNGLAAFAAFGFTGVVLARRTIQTGDAV